MSVLQKVSINGYSNSNNTHPWYSHYNVFDGSIESFWESASACSPSNPIYLSYTWLTKSYVVTRYRLYLDPASRPIDWKFQGSNDQVIWTDLDIQTAQTGDRFEWKTYDISNDQYYSSYRLLCYVGASYDYSIRITEMELWADESTITTSTTTTSTSTTSTTITVTTPTPSTSLTTLTSSTLTTVTTNTGPSLSISTTTPPDPERLWPMEEELSIVRDNFNQWYKSGIPLGVKQVDELPVWLPEYEGSIIYSTSSDKYYFATSTEWKELFIGSVPHAQSHLSGSSDELIHIGPDAPDESFVGKLWIYTDNLLSTTTTTTTLTTTTYTTLPTLTSTTSLSTTSTSSSTYTTTTTLSTTQSTTTIYQNPINVATGGQSTADSWEIGYESLKAFDGVSATKWLTNAYQDYFPHWIKYTLPTAYAVHTYSILWDMDRYAYSWYLEGSNNSYIWDTLDFIDGHIPLIGVNYYHFTNSTNYKYYRFRFISGSDTRRNSLGIYQIELYAGGVTTTSTTSTTTTSTSSTQTTSTTLTTISSSTQLVYGFLSAGGYSVASDQYLGYPVSNAFDGSTTSYWICDVLSGPPYWIMYYWTNTAYIVNKYNLHIQTPGRPKSWKFQGSSDGTVWVDLDVQNDVYEEGDLEFIFNNSDFYSYYRLYITETHSSGYAVRVGNLELYGYRSELSTTTTTESTTSTTTTLTTTTTASTTTASTTVYVPLTQKLLLNFNGSNNSIQTTDDTGRHYSIVWNNDALIKTDRSAFGTSSLYIPSDTYYPSSSEESYIMIPDSYDWQLGDGRGNFSIDFWMYIEKYQYLWKNWNTIVSHIQDKNNYWSLRYYPEGGLFNFSLRVNKILLVNYTSVVNWSYGQWNHIALTRVGNLFKFYHNGDGADLGSIFDITIPKLTGPLLIGKGPSEYLNTSLDFNQGSYWLDSLRIYLGSLFTSDFDIPTQPTTSTTVSTSSSSTTSYIRNYTPKLSLPCNDGEYSIYDTTGRHGISNLPTTCVFTPQFRSTASKLLDPVFGTVFLSSHKYPLDINNSESGYLTYPYHSDWRLSGSNDFTIECWLAYKNTQNRYESPILSFYQDASNFWYININCDQRKFYFKLIEAGSQIISYSANINLQSLSWNYFALIRSSKRFRLYWNGSPSSDWSELFNVIIPDFSGSLIVLGGPSASNYSQLISSGIACNGLRISEGIVDGITSGSIPTSQF